VQGSSSVEQRIAVAPLTLVPTGYEQLHDTNMRRWKRQLIPTVMILTDFLLALLIWRASLVLQGIWGNGALSEMTTVAMFAVITSWVGLRALLGLYPGYGLDSVEQLRKHTYATFAILAMVAIFAFGFQLGLMLSRLLLALVFLGLLVLTPFAQHFMKSWMKRIDLWGKLVVVLRYKEAGTNVVNLLSGQWELGYDPVAVFDHRLDAVGALSEDSDQYQTLAPLWM
jgi:hypothetical protein